MRRLFNRSEKALDFGYRLVAFRELGFEVVDPVHEAALYGDALSGKVYCAPSSVAVPAASTCGFDLVQNLPLRGMNEKVDLLPPSRGVQRGPATFLSGGGAHLFGNVFFENGLHLLKGGLAFTDVFAQQVSESLNQEQSLLSLGFEGVKPISDSTQSGGFHGSGHAERSAKRLSVLFDPVLSLDLLEDELVGRKQVGVEAGPSALFGHRGPTSAFFGLGLLGTHLEPRRFGSRDLTGGGETSDEPSQPAVHVPSIQRICLGRTTHNV